MSLIDFTNCNDDNELFDGEAGAKKGIIYNNEKWILKFGKNTKSMNNVNISYTTSPISEYIGSKIYESIGIPVHKCLLGKYDGINNKNERKSYLVVACKNFKTDINDKFYSFLEVANNFNPNIDDYGNNLDFLITIDKIKNNKFIDSKLFLERFYNMFIIDTLINNNDRHYGNFGIIENLGKYTLAPVYDNGSSFYNKLDNDKVVDFLTNEEKFISSVYESRVSIFELNGKKINPYKLIESMKYEGLNNAVKRIVPLIDLEDIFEIIDSIPESIFSSNMKLFYKKSFSYGYTKLLKVYKNLQ